AVTLPAALFVINAYPLKRIGGENGWTSATARRVYAEIVPFALLSAAAGFLLVKSLPPVVSLSPGEEVAAAFFSIGFFFWKTIAPVGLSPLYEMPVHFDGLAPRFLAAYAVAAAFLIVGLLSIRRWPGVAAGIFGFVLLSFPLLGVVQNGPQISADRYTYQ